MSSLSTGRSCSGAYLCSASTSTEQIHVCRGEMQNERPAMNVEEWTQARRDYSMIRLPISHVYQSVPSVRIENMVLYTEREAVRGSGRY